MYSFLFEEIILEANICCKQCGEVLKHNFDEKLVEQKKEYVCGCGKCSLFVLSRKRVYAVKGDNIDNSISVIKPFKTSRNWRK